jgi:hypothetical protein
VVCAISSQAPPARAQSPDAADVRPAFSLSSSHIANTRERPAIGLMFRRVRSLDFRVYRVDDPLKFLAGLRDPHALGSEAPVVPQEQTLLERIARWKARQRDSVLTFLRGQFSHTYRRTQRETAAKSQIAFRQPLEYRQFAQVPLLNRTQLVTSWRETLPPVRETEVRKIPLDLPGEGVYVVEAVSAPFKAYTVVIVSDLGLVTKSSPGQLVMFAANRFTGEPAVGCPAEVIANRAVVASGLLDSDGMYEAAVPDSRPDDIVALVRCGKQVAATDPGSWFFQDQARDLAGYIYTDKPIYRPGHTVNIKGVLRWRVGDALAPFDRKQVEVIVSDPNDKVVFRQQTGVDEFGAVLASLPVPRGAALGIYSIRLVSGDVEAGGGFEVQEYRKPEFEVIVKPAARFVVQGGRAVASVNARYYFGQPVANGLVKYVVHKQPFYSPVRWSADGDDERAAEPWWFGGEEARQGTARLDENGLAEISVPLEPNESGHDYSVRIEASVADASSREVAGNTIVHATFGRFLLVARADNYAYRPGSQATVAVKALDYAGTAQPNLPVTVALERLTYDQGRWEKPRTTRVSQGHVTTDADGRAAWPVALPDQPGNYQFRTEAASDGRVIFDTAFVWISGRSTSADDESARELELIPDKPAYQPGDVARLTIKGDASAAAMLVTKEARQVGWRKVLRSAATTVEVPIADGDVGDIYVNVAFLKDDRLYRAEKRLKVPAVSRQLQVTVSADQPVAKPRQPATFTVQVRDASGRPVRAQVSLSVIDEAVYGVKPDNTADPLRFFYRREYSRVGTEFSRDYSFIGYSGAQQLMLAQRRRPMALADFKGDRPAQPQVRKDFPDAIYWTGNLLTGADGTARIQLAYPDALTTWRVTARAVTADTLVGTTVARTTVTEDLIVRVVTPRFLTEGDEVVVPTIVHNYLPATKAVTVAMKADGVSVPAGETVPQPQQATIAQSGEARHDWRFTANRVGSAVFTASATTDADSDAVELSIPVLPFGLKRTSGAAGSIAGEGEAKAELTIPSSANPAARTIRVALAPSLAGPLLGALDFLTSYPYGCTEQTLSSFLPNLLVTRALDQLKIAPAERMQALDRQVSEGLTRLYDYQHEDGGWGWWKTDENHPFMTAYAVYGLLEARRAGYKVDSVRLRNGARALKQLFDTYPRAVPDLKAYMAYVLTEAQVTPEPDGASQGRSDAGRQAVDQAWARRASMTPYGQALMLLSLDALKDRRGDDMAGALAGNAQKTGDLVWWSVKNDPLLDDDGDTSVEATAFVVKALSARDPKSPLLEPAVRWLLLNRNYGAWWSSTKQTAMALYGLLDYMRARREGAADASVEVVVNGAPVATRAFTAQSLTAPDPVVVSVPAAAGRNTIVVRKKGGGSLYWSATAEYYDTAGASARTGTRKLALVRKYYSLTPVRVQNRIVYRETAFDGHAQPGDLLLVRVDAAGSPDWRYLMIEDPLPAGVEAVQQRSLYELERKTEFWDGSRREYRDDRVVFFQESFAAGHYQFVYLLKVTTPGVFRAMPAQISAMYVADATASSESQTLTVGAAPRPGGTGK